ncbi:MAG TPA: peptidylprolyl isomerase [Candidatus Baltobacteraceae bacterium]|nr:peptidylprolyl isomerase [Candidatus Baltobacteraceae bacterium]
MIALLLAASLLVRIETTLGNITVRLDPEHAPRTTAGFMRCVDSGKLNGTEFYRVVRPGNQSPRHPTQVIQGGLNADTSPFPPLPLESTRETGLRNVAGTIAIPRDKTPNSGSPCDFFINMADNLHLDADRDPDGYGYAVFGKVISGMNVARRIDRAPAKSQKLSPPIRIVRILRVK